QDYLFTGIAGYVHPKNNPNPPPYPIAAMPEFDTANPKGIQFFISDYVIRSAIDATFTIGSMNVHLDKVLMNHHIKMTCSATKSPDFAFVNAIRVTMDVNCVVDFDDNVNNRFTLVTGLTIALKEYVRAAVIFFSMQEAKFNKLEYKQEKPVDIKWFKDGINKVLAAVIEIANSELGQKGIPLPTVKGIDYTDTVEFVKAGYMEICTNPIFKITTLEEEVADAFAN
ncbi:MAG: hypothetical protein P4L10_13060, partial [Acidobacteriaceae bacterium]|nr:hypothetical protein [Acidobacteriaceae bacterium]